MVTLSLSRLLVELAPGLLGGYLLGRFKPEWVGPLATPLVRFGVPISLMGLLLKGGLNQSLLQMAALAAVAILLMLFALRAWGKRFDQLLSPTLQLGSSVGNTAYFGIPVALALLPPEALPISIGYDFGATLLAWGLGPIWITQVQNRPNPKRLKILFDNLSSSPATRGLFGALLVMATPWQTTITTVLWVPSRIVIVLALVVVGMRLASLSVTNTDDYVYPSALNVAVGFKLLLFPAFMFALSLVLPISPVARQALVLQAAAPSAISVLLMAETEQADVDLAAQLIWRSTLLAIITVPVWSLLLWTLGEKL